MLEIRTKRKRSALARAKAEIGRFRRRLGTWADARRVAQTLANDARTDRRLAVRLRGGIGDHIIGARFLRDLQAAVGPFRFDVYSSRPSLVGWLLASFPGYQSCYLDEYLWEPSQPHYALAIEINQLFLPAFAAADWRFLSTHYPRLAEICSRAKETIRRLEPCVRYHPFLDGHLSRIAVFMGGRRHDLMHRLCDIAYGGDQLDLAVDEDVIERAELSKRRYITINNGFDAQFNHRTTTATKVYPHGERLVELIKAHFNHLTVVQVGAETSVPIKAVDANLTNTTSLAQVSALLKHSLLHIDNEGGLVHIAASMGTTSCVFFGPTDPGYFGYESNINVSPATCGNCYWITSEWMNACIRGFQQPPCLYQVRPDSGCVK